MTCSCCVVDCEIGYKNNKEKISTFAFLKNKVLQKKWIKSNTKKKFDSV